MVPGEPLSQANCLLTKLSRTLEYGGVLSRSSPERALTLAARGAAEDITLEGRTHEMTDRFLEESHFKVLRLLEENPDLSQRDLAKALGISLGKINYCMRILLDNGWIKMQNFRSNENKQGYVYLLTPAGITAKAQMTRSFLTRKMQASQILNQEIAQLRTEIDKWSVEKKE